MRAFGNVILRRVYDIRIFRRHVLRIFNTSKLRSVILYMFYMVLKWGNVILRRIFDICASGNVILRRVLDIGYFSPSFWSYF